MEGKDNIKELFSQKLGSYEAKVNPELWAKISTQVAVGATATVATGLSLFTKIAIGLGVSAAAITTAVILSTPSEEIGFENPIIEVQKEVPNIISTQKEKITEIQEQEIDELNLDENQLSSISTPPPFTEVYLVPKTDKRIEKESSINDIQLKGIKSVNSVSSAPMIVEGVSYQGMTNYGTTPVNQPEVVQELVTPKVKAVKRYVNVFTPNGDGRNDFFFLENENVTDFSVVVFDPLGEIVFQSNDPRFKWDGRDIRSGEIVVSGTYMYMVSAYDSEENPFPIYERLTIITN